MKIILNNRFEEIEATELTVNELINYKNFSFRMLVTKVNGQLVKKVERDNILVRDGDTVEVLHLISGG
ncbi:MAG: sulfur carrier protein ThiS [Bacteroidales bacterium]|nr:sulfur carrier protein ThiS [Bacteroidales bacterium]